MSRRLANHPRDHSWWSPPPETAISHVGKLAEKARMRLEEQPSIRADPRGRRDGRCVSCRSSRSEVAVKNGDPFCSTACARDWHRQLAASPSTSG